jgi:DHA1 family multidrug resistance protein B-like MFS transporter
LHPNLKVRFYESLLRNILANTVHPFMAIYFAERFGLTAAGILLTVNVMVGAVAGFYGGPHADRKGRRSIMLVAEYLRFFAFAMMALANSPWFDSAVVTYLMTVVMSAFVGFSQPAADAMLIDCSTEKNRTYVYSLGYWSWNVAVLAGGLLGGFLFKTHLFEVFLSAAAVSFISLVVLLFFIKETYHPAPEALHKHKPGNPFAFLSAYRQVGADKLFMLFALAHLLFLSIDLMAMRYSSVRLSAEMEPQTLFAVGGFDFVVDGIRMFGILSAENALLVVLVGLLVPHITKRFAETHVLTAAISLSAVGFAVISVSAEPWMLLVMMALATAGEMMGVPITQKFLARIVPEQSRSTYMAAYGLTYQIRMMVGSLAITLGAFLSSWMMGCLFLLVGFISILLFLNVLNLRSRAEQEGRRRRLTHEAAHSWPREMPGCLPRRERQGAIPALIARRQVRMARRRKGSGP